MQMCKCEDMQMDLLSYRTMLFIRKSDSHSFFSFAHLHIYTFAH